MRHFHALTRVLLRLPFRVEKGLGSDGDVVEGDDFASFLFRARPIVDLGGE